MPSPSSVVDVSTTVTLGVFPRQPSRRRTGCSTTRSAGTPHDSARAHPNTCHSSCPGACASVSMVKSHPMSSAMLSSRRGGSSRSGRELISTATPKWRQASNTISASNSDSGRTLPPRPRGVTLRPVQCPRTSVRRIRDRGHHPGRHVGGRHAQLGVDAGHDDVQLGQQRGVLVERAVLEDVDLDPGEDPERRQLLVELTHHVQLASQPLGGEPVGDGEPWRVVAQHHPLVPQVARRPRHLRDRRAAVRPVRVGVAVTLERRPQGGACAGRDVSWLPGQRLDLGQIGRYVAALRLEHDAGGGRPHPLEVLQRARGQPGLQLTGGQLVDRRCGRPKGPHPVRRLVRPLEDVRHPPQRLDSRARHPIRIAARRPTRRCRGPERPGRTRSGRPRSRRTR